MFRCDMFFCYHLQAMRSFSHCPQQLAPAEFSRNGCQQLSLPNNQRVLHILAQDLQHLLVRPGVKRLKHRSDVVDQTHLSQGLHTPSVSCATHNGQASATNILAPCGLPATASLSTLLIDLTPATHRCPSRGTLCRRECEQCFHCSNVRCDVEFFMADNSTASAPLCRICLQQRADFPHPIRSAPLQEAAERFNSVLIARAV